MVFVSKSYENARLKKIAALTVGDEVLDIGFAQLPNVHLRAEFVVGLDLESPRKPSGYSEEIIGDATNVVQAVPGRQFDTVIASEIIEHLENPYAFVRSLKQILKPGGRIIISTPNPVGFPCILFEWSMSQRYFYTEHHLYYFSPRWMQRLLRKCDFTLIATKGVGLWLPGITLPCPNAMSYQVIYVAE